MPLAAGRAPAASGPADPAGAASPARAGLRTVAIAIPSALGPGLGRSGGGTGQLIGSGLRACSGALLAAASYPSESQMAAARIAASASAAGPSGAARSAASAIPPVSAAMARRRAMFRPATRIRAPAAASVLAVAAPMPEDPPVSSTVACESPTASSYPLFAAPTTICRAPAGTCRAPPPAPAALRVSIGLFVRRLRQAPVHGELTLPEISALSRLDRAGPATPGALAKVEQISPQAMGATLSMLAERGLVERRPDPADGRRAVMSLTEAGRRAIRTKRTARTEQLAKALSDGFTRSELHTLMAAAALIERLGEAI
jgi:DNA-binding MarR family transcriptional regulator